MGVGMALRGGTTSDLFPDFMWTASGCATGTWDRTWDNGERHIRRCTLRKGGVGMWQKGANKRYADYATVRLADAPGSQEIGKLQGKG